MVSGIRRPPTRRPAIATVTGLAYAELVTKYPQAAGASLYINNGSSATGAGWCDAHSNQGSPTCAHCSATTWTVPDAAADDPLLGDLPTTTRSCSGIASRCGDLPTGSVPGPMSRRWGRDCRPAPRHRRNRCPLKTGLPSVARRC